MALFGGEYASHLANVPMLQVPVEMNTDVRRGRPLDEVFEGVAFWRELTDEEVTALRDGNDRFGLSSFDRPPVVLECDINGKAAKFSGYIQKVAENSDFYQGKSSTRKFYVLVKELTPEERQQLAPFCQCMGCHPYLSSRANIECVKDAKSSHWAILDARKAQRAAQNRWCTIV